MVPIGTDPKLTRMGLAFTLEPLEPYHLETQSVLPFGSSVNGQRLIERSQKRTDMKMRDDSFVCIFISRAKHRRKLDFCDCFLYL